MDFIKRKVLKNPLNVKIFITQYNTIDMLNLNVNSNFYWIRHFSHLYLLQLGLNLIYWCTLLEPTQFKQAILNDLI